MIIFFKHDILKKVMPKFLQKINVYFYVPY